MLMDEEKKKRKKKTSAGEAKEHKARSAQGDAPHRENYKAYMASVEDIQNFLMDRILLRHNTVSGRTEFREPDGEAWQPISDRVVNTLWAELSAQKKVRVDDIWRVIGSDFAPAFNPFSFYLEHLPPWDGQDYILGMSVSVTVKGDTAMQMRFYEYLKKWLVAMVAGWLDAEVPLLRRRARSR